MPRINEPGLQTLIDSGHCVWYDAVDLELRGQPPTYLSNGEITVGEKDYKAQLDEVAAFEASLNLAVDQIKFEVQNVSMEMGRSLAGATNPMNGARGMLGVIFQNEDDPSEIYYDPKMPGEVVTGTVDNQVVEFNLVSDLDVVVVSGRNVSEVFEWKEPIRRTSVPDRDDLIPPGGGIIFGDDGTIIFNPGGGRESHSGRYPTLDRL